MQVKLSFDKAPKYTLKSSKQVSLTTLKLFFNKRNFKQHENISYKTESSFDAQFNMKSDNMNNQT